MDDLHFRPALPRKSAVGGRALVGILCGMLWVTQPGLYGSSHAANPDPAARAQGRQIALASHPASPELSVPKSKPSTNGEDKPSTHGAENAAGSTASGGRPQTGQTWTLDLGAKRKMTFVYVRAGTFLMSSPPDEKGRGSDEGQIRVTLTKDFWMGETEVTQTQYLAVTGLNPSRIRNAGNLPVEQVTWEEAVRFCELLS